MNKELYLRKFHNLYFILLCVFTILPQFSFAQIPAHGTEAFGDRLIMGVVDQEGTQFNPFQIYSPIERDILQLIFGHGLIQAPNKYGSPPSLIDRYVYRSGQESNRVWRFVLRRNIVFQDGTDVRNTDAQFTFRVLKKYGGFILNRKLDFDNIKSFSIDGDLEFKIELFKSDKKFDEKLSNIPILSRKYYKDVLTKGYEVFNQKTPMGLGPFAFVSRTSNTLNLRYHPHYFSGRPFLNNITIKFVQNQQQLVNQLVSGDLDYIEIEDRVTAQQLHQLMGRKTVVFTVPRPEKKLFIMMMNLRKFPFSESTVRRAIYLALDRKRWVDRFLKQNGEVAHTLFDRDSPYYYHQLFKNEYNPAKALRILKLAGWKLNSQTGILEKNGKPLTFNLLFSKNSFLEESIARSIKINLAELNINVKPIPIDPSQLNRILNGNGFNSIVYSYEYDPQYPFEALENFYFDILRGSPNAPNYQNRYVDRLFNLAYQNPKVRQNLYHRFQYYVQRENPAIFLFFDNRVIIAVSSRFRNVRSTFRDGESFFFRLNPLENWFVPKNLQKYAF